MNATTMYHRASGPVLTPTRRPGLLAAIERALQRAAQTFTPLRTIKP